MRLWQGTPTVGLPIFFELLWPLNIATAGNKVPHSVLAQRPADVIHGRPSLKPYQCIVQDSACQSVRMTIIQTHVIA